MESRKRKLRLDVGLRREGSRLSVRVGVYTPIIQPNGAVAWREVRSLSHEWDIANPEDWRQVERFLEYGIKQKLSDSVAGITDPQRKAEHIVNNFRTLIRFENQKRESKLAQIQRLTEELRKALAENDTAKANQIAQQIAELSK